MRTAAIKGEDGKVLFEQTNCEVPTFWSQLATNVVVSKYFYGENGTPEREYSVRQLIHRVSRTIADWGIDDGYFASPEDGERFYRDLTWLCLHQHGAFNSPVWFNVGLFHQYGVKGAQCNWHWDAESETVKQPENPYEYPQGSACFIQSVNDNMEDIMELATARPCCLSSARAREPIYRPCARIGRNSRAAASQAGRCRSCGCTTKLRRW